MSFAHIFADIFVVFGVIFVLSLLGYLIPQFIIRILKPLDLKKRYGGGFAFITGGNSGMGEQFAKKVAKMGFDIIILAEDEDRLNKVAKEINDVNPQCRVIIINADLSGDPETVTEQVVAKLQNVDISIMFFNAGYGVVELAANPSENTLRQFRTNIVAHQYLFQALYPKLASRIIGHNQQQGAIRRGGVLFTASLAGFIYPPGSHVYGATKEYLGHLGECLATEAE
ncbi:MAG: putative 17 beta-hydroxysteroid dehydrogenase type 3, partial [Streblomastix strix]